MVLIQELRDAFSTPGQALLHLSFLLLVVSMTMRDIAALRALAIASGVASICYRMFFVYDPVSVLWQSLLIGVNVVQLAILWAERFRARLSDDEEFFIATVIPTVHRSKARKLIRTGHVITVEAGERLTTDGVLVPKLMFVVEGVVRIDKHGQQVATCSRGDFLGEMSVVTGEPASADAFAATAVRYLAFSREPLQRVLSADTELRHALESSFNRNLIGKLVKTNSRLKQGQAPESV